MNRKIWKKSSEELEEYMKFKHRGGSPKPKKGKGSFSRKKKHTSKFENSSDF